MMRDCLEAFSGSAASAKFHFHVIGSIQFDIYAYLVMIQDMEVNVYNCGFSLTVFFLVRTEEELLFWLMVTLKSS